MSCPLSFLAIVCSLLKAHGADGTVSVIPDPSGTGASYLFDGGAIDGAAGAKSGTIAPAIDSVFEELATDEFAATVAFDVVLTVIKVPLETAVVVLVVMVALVVLDDKVLEIVAASSDSTILDAFAEVLADTVVLAGAVAFADTDGSAVAFCVCTNEPTCSFP